MYVAKNAVKVLIVVAVSFAIGWSFYRCTHDDYILKEDYSKEEAEFLEKQKRLKEIQKSSDQEAKTQGYERYSPESGDESN